MAYKCENCNNTPVPFQLEHEGDFVQLYDCLKCGEYVVFPEDVNDKSHSCGEELEEVVISNERGDEYKLYHCDSCGYYSSEE